MRKLSTAVLVAGVAFVTMVAGCGGGGGTGGGGNPPPVTGQTIVKGRVVNNKATPQPVALVQVTLGSQTFTTGADGRFSFDLGTNVPVSSVSSDIKVSTKLLPPDQYDELPVTYAGVQYDQALDGTGASIPLDAISSVSGTTADLGTITVQWIDPSNPPPPPSFP